MEKYTYYRPTIAKINLQAIKNNVANLKKHLKLNSLIINAIEIRCVAENLVMKVIQAVQKENVLFNDSANLRVKLPHTKTILASSQVQRMLMRLSVRLTERLQMPARNLLPLRLRFVKLTVKTNN